MKQQLAITGAVALALLTAGTTAQAQSAGSFYVTTGWFHLAPQDSSDPLKVMSVGGTPVNRSVANTGAGISDADTLGITTGYFVTDHIAAEFVYGIPPKFNLNGKGSLSPFGTLGHAYQWSPAVLLKYYFNSAEAKFRPYVGVGASYIYFTGAKLTNRTFENNVLGGPTNVTTSNQWAPVFNAGFNYNFTKHWFAGVSISYIPVSLTATLTTQRPTQVGTLTQTSQAHIKLNPIVSYVNIGYRF
ncbi:OmpW/AlkL family protein [Burkholderia glumae]|uniref:OmpW family protein n=1 Tax=Burkholderia glumae TaxID=337 RepID=A0AAP9Y1R1_BURGL|nr:OmpW family outer membrane protein [Burkholderia glumae]ACR27512.1 Outer membrane protein, OmpW family [Burkholderia glumae BGR1]AJY66997.1 ompW family protein [Burkholderia glumae LMG 2196 = ATCC 33617]KHJ63382.1 membrane protein [Burkholderia glumae]MCM2481527.1 outer membrane beta-barrel protein [Burkholderia glumae]MCM2491838.1 outer membrane beta-barrel protein [Burkholderia glumae]